MKSITSTSTDFAVLLSSLILFVAMMAIATVISVPVYCIIRFLHG